MVLPNPILVLEKKKHSREGFAQFMLASLLMGEPPEKWNTPYCLSPFGMQVLSACLSEGFGEVMNLESASLFWEFRLESPGQDGGRWPDLALRSENQLVLFELKTEAGSIREGQVDEYLELAVLQFPESKIDMIYLTRDPVSSSPSVTGRTRYVNMTWSEIVTHLTDHSHDLSDKDRVICHLFGQYLEEVLSSRGAKATPYPEEPEDELESALQDQEGELEQRQLIQVPTRVEQTGDQEVLHLTVASPKEALHLCQNIRERIRKFNLTAKEKIAHAAPWVWTIDSGGSPQSKSGRENGVEVRVSYYRNGNGLVQETAMQ